MMMFLKHDAVCPASLTITSTGSGSVTEVLVVPVAPMDVCPSLTKKVNPKGWPEPKGKRARPLDSRRALGVKR